MSKTCEFCQWFKENNYQNTFKSEEELGMGFRAEKDPIFVTIYYCPLCGAKLKEKEDN